MFESEQSEARREQWEASYERSENFLFYPNEELVRAVSKHVRKRTGLSSYEDVLPARENGELRFLDLGCGIGRHLRFALDLAFEAYGLDLSMQAVRVARRWLQPEEKEKRRGARNTCHLLQGEITRLPWTDGFFDVVVSHGVLDHVTMPVAREGITEVSRVLREGGIFYCDLVSGDDSSHAREYSGEEVVNADHERGTIQSYYNFTKIKRLLPESMEISDCYLVRREQVLREGTYTSRYHLTLVESSLDG